VDCVAIATAAREYRGETFSTSWTSEVQQPALLAGSHTRIARAERAEGRAATVAELTVIRQEKTGVQHTETLDSSL